MIRLTVFTPAYNRAHTLPRTYESLCNQKCKDFCWLIIDDGSTDDTEQLVKGWMEKDNGFEIQYIYKENGGMHTAHNTAYENIITELNVCIDSDDCMAKDGVAKILKKWDEVKDSGYAGWKQYLKNPKGFAFWRKICMRYPESRKRKIVDCIHYCSSSQIAKDKGYIRESPAKFMTFLCSPLGVVLTMMVKHKARK